jgi:hypothetical protein
MKAHPDLLRAIALNCLVAAHLHTKRQLVSTDVVKRTRAEDALAARIVLALRQVG